MELNLELALAGVGAIGNGVICLLRQIGVRGKLWVADKDDYIPENYGTCLLIGPMEIGTPKAAFAERWLGDQMTVRAWPENISKFRQRMPHEVPYPKIVLSALDNIDARHEVQDLWPDVVIDGAIGDFPCQVSVHPWGRDVACLRCLFNRAGGERAERAAARTTGLSLERVGRPFDLVTDHDVESARPEKKAWLKLRIGKQICSVVREGVAESISREKQPFEFQPSVPFVACFSATMIVRRTDQVCDGRADDPRTPVSV